MNDQPCEVPIQELLRAIPRDHRLTIEIDWCHHRMIPVGVHCHRAADALDAAIAAKEEIGRELAEMKSLLDGKCANYRDGELVHLREDIRVAKERIDLLEQANTAANKVIGNQATELQGIIFKIEADNLALRSTVEKMRSALESCKMGWHPPAPGHEDNGIQWYDFDESLVKAALTPDAIGGSK